MNGNRRHVWENPGYTHRHIASSARISNSRLDFSFPGFEMRKVGLAFVLAESCRAKHALGAVSSQKP